MIYSNFYKQWISTCMRCGLATIKFETNCSNQKMKKVLKKKFYNLQILKDYFNVDKNFLGIRSNCTVCFNENCRAYMKYQ